MQNNNNGILSMQEEDRPREKLLEKGKESLTNSELLAILINTGTRKKTAIDLSNEILKLCNFNLNLLTKLSIEDLCCINGIGKAKAITILAAIELGRRREKSDALNNPLLKNSAQIFQYIKTNFLGKNAEEFWVISLDNKLAVIKSHKISEGGYNSTIADVRKILKLLLLDKAIHFVIAHNHPSGILNPSESDFKITRKIYEAGKILDIALIDHLIVCDNQYYSFADNGKLF